MELTIDLHFLKSFFADRSMISDGYSMHYIEENINNEKLHIILEIRKNNKSIMKRINELELKTLTKERVAEQERIMQEQRQRLFYDFVRHLLSAGIAKIEDIINETKKS